MAAKYPIKVNNSGDATEILIHGPIGKSWWDDDGVSSKDFINELKSVPSGKKIIIGINSQGGNIQDGLAIYNAIDARRADITARVDGYAVSIASVIPLAASKVISPKSSIWMIHEPWSLTQGDAEDHRKSADMLDTHAEVLVSAYVKKTGKTDDQIRSAMKEETWLSGEEAQEWNLADEITDDEPVLNVDFSAAFCRHNPLKGGTQSYSLARFASFMARRETLSAHAGGATTKQQDQTMKREEIIALLETWGVTVADNATDEWLKSELGKGKPAAAIDGAVKTDARLEKLEAKYEAERKTRLKASLAALVTNDQLTEAQATEWLPRVLVDETILAQIQTWPKKPVPAEPVNFGIEVLSEDPREIEKAILKTIAPLNQITSGEEARKRGLARAEIIKNGWPRLKGAFAANTVSTDLKRTVILQQAIRAFAVRHLPLTAFSSVLGGQRLEGTNKVAVPYFALASATATTFVDANGYDTFTDIGNDAKVVTIDKRKYIGLKWTSAELARQPYMDVAMGAQLLVEQLAVGVVEDVLSIVTVANYGAAVKSEAAAAFDSDDVADLKGVADLANWPVSGRSLILNSPYDVNLLKDESVKDASAWGDSAPVREGRIFRFMGFDYFADGRVPANGEDLQGFIAWKSAILFATSPITPTPEVRSQLSRYEVIVEPSSGATFEYRLWGNPDMDQSREVIEVNYGFAVGEAAALKRITG